MEIQPFNKDKSHINQKENIKQKKKSKSNLKKQSKEKHSQKKKQSICPSFLNKSFLNNKTENKKLNDRSNYTMQLKNNKSKLKKSRKYILNGLKTSFEKLPRNQQIKTYANSMKQSKKDFLFNKTFHAQRKSHKKQDKEKNCENQKQFNIKNRNKHFDQIQKSKNILLEKLPLKQKQYFLKIIKQYENLIKQLVEYRQNTKQNKQKHAFFKQIQNIIQFDNQYIKRTSLTHNFCDFQTKMERFTFTQYPQKNQKTQAEIRKISDSQFQSSQQNSEDQQIYKQKQNTEILKVIKKCPTLDLFKIKKLKISEYHQEFMDLQQTFSDSWKRDISMQKKF